jgi:hypothetical protein
MHPLRINRPLLTLAILAAVSATAADGDRIDDVDPAALDTQTATDNGSPQESGVRTLIFRSLESPDVNSHPENCPFIKPGPVANLFLGAHLYSIAERASDSEVVNDTVQDIGIAAACGVLTLPVIASTVVPFYIVFTLGNGPDRGDKYIAQGECRPARPTFDVPKTGVLLAGCVLDLLSGPEPFLGGAATSLSIFNLRQVSGVTTGSFWTIRSYSQTQ